MGDVWVAPVPRCPVHNRGGGTMRLNMAMDTWSCRGWDGEGCDYEVREEDRHDYEYLGTTDGPLPFPGEMGGYTGEPVYPAEAMGGHGVVLSVDPANPNIAFAFGEEDSWTSKLFPP